MTTTIQAKATIEEMQKIFDILNVREYHPISNVPILFNVTIRHNENEDAVKLFKSAKRKVTK